MNTPYLRRWNVGFVAMRWRRLFWLLPLAALLVGTAVEWRKYLKHDQAIGIFQTQVRKGSPGLEELREIVLSDEILGAASFDAFLLCDWGPKEECVARLRPMITVEPILGTSLVEITVKGRKTFRTVAICDALIDRSVKYVQELEDRMFWKLAEQKKARVEELEVAIDAKRAEIAGYSAGGERQVQAARELAKMESERLRILDSQMRCILLEEPLIIHERPLPPKALSWRDFAEAGTPVSIAVGSSVIAAFALAYLLELLIPRRG